MSIQRALHSAVRVARPCLRSTCSHSPAHSPISAESFLKDSGPCALRRRESCSTRLSTFQSRPFSSSRCLLKKGGKAKGGRKEEQADSSKSRDVPSDDPFDFTRLEADITECLEQVKDDLSKLRAGGRFNPEVVENLRVQPDKNSSQMVKLSDVAQVIPKGRTVQVVVGEKDHIKPVTTAVQTSDLSLTPQPDPTGTNPLLLILTIPPPTAESRKQAVTAAVEAGHKARLAISSSRAKQQKKHRTMQQQKSARPDDLKKAGDQMEKIVDKAQDEAKKIVDSAKRVLESG